MLATAKRLARYFVDRMPEDHVVYWDFDVPATPETKRDSSASAIAAAGMLEIAGFLRPNDSGREWLLDAVRQADIRGRYREAGIEPVEQDVAQVRAAVADRLRMVDSMREAVFGRRRSS